ncbi:unnamed protein product [Rotaria socialis]|uniref:Uncharacterized protein n=1 Tax=Rotaria socialis TaxID=392032 RepID=A0A817XNS2_9BILA|nr:unnamed protein product [Rotaria socialis]CAF3215408.1 unnamed protein product [Rotaria socialis]CAF3368844.1 unnamed protein product [Rotaria socialis]CAF4246953.1 unnamed protein product [Rotaria socialis]CAF4398616.1 unnamed protein product [Rotaria socialis]
MSTNTQTLVNTMTVPRFSASLCNNQHFVLVWLDVRITDYNQDSINTLHELKRVVGVINTFVDIDSCTDFIKSTENEKIFMIVSGSLGQTIVPLIHEKSQVTSIYIFCGDRSNHVDWVKAWSKIKGVFMNILPICDALEQAVRQCDQDSVPLSFFQTDAESSTIQLDQLDQSFTYTSLLKESLFKIRFSKRTVKEFTAYCRTQFSENDLDMIDKFESNYKRLKAIWWYTNQCFLYPMLNRSLRMMEVDTIIKMGFFMQDLHRHIKKLHKEQLQDKDSTELFIVYRGQGLSNVDFTKMMKAKGGLISFNSFLSSSRKESIAQIYARRAITEFGLMGIVFKMLIDPSICSTPFALINDLSFYRSSEQEILFSMHTIFRIGEIKKLEFHNDRLWEVELTLTSEQDQQFNALTQLIRRETGEENGWYALGQLLLKLGKFEKAEEMYTRLLNETSNSTEKDFIYHQLAWIKHNIGDYTAAIKLYETSLKIDSGVFYSSGLTLATTYHNMGLVYEKLGDYIKSQAAHDKALKIYRGILDPDQLDLATSLGHNGLIYVKLGDYIQALSNHKEALKIYEKKLPPNHLLLATSYHNIGLVYDKMDDYATARMFYDKTLAIYRKTLPPNHPDLAVCYQNIGKTLEKMCEYEKALKYHTKALEIFQKTLPSNHIDLGNCYSCIALAYNHVGEYSKAIPFYEIAQSIFTSALPPNHPDLISLYNNIGEAYDNMKEHVQALSYYSKALQLYQQTLVLNDSLLASIYFRLAHIHYNMNCYDKALFFAEQSIDISKRVITLNRHDIEIHNRTVALVKKISN